MDTVPAQISDIVKGKIRELIGSLIPDDEYDKLVKQVYQNFIRSELPGLIQGELRKHYVDLIKEEMAKPHWQERWNPEQNRRTASALVYDILVKAAPEMQAAVMAQVTQFMVENMRNNVLPGMLR